ncbi:RDD family protein [Paenibacillus soyae]|uniref:RDD family protein n=1 Tax=Paenibacillus soyae TaxID=2969249 RepID=A0A9X2MQ23_9BACL|nr:RDD family protein [Paenibacillus soyae]MCR2804152.1 RDD family protein [Paenibacillus soyae]
MEHQMGHAYPYPPPPPPPADPMESLMRNYGSSIFFKRWGATVVDFLFMIGLGLALLLMPSSLFGIGLVIYILFYLLYYVLLEGLTGYTVGKLLFRIRAVRADGRAPGFVKGLIRATLRIVDTNPLLMGALPAGICVLATKKKQRLGDMAANTYVLNARDVLPDGKRFPVGLTLAAVGAIVGSIALAATSIAIAAKTPGSIIGPSQPETFLSLDGKFQVTADDSWSLQDDLHDEADLSIGNMFAEKYMVVLTQPKSDFDADFTLDDFSGQVVNSFAEGRALPIVPYPFDGGMYKSEQFTFVENVDGYSVTYLVTSIETEEHYHQVIVWTLAEKYERLKQELTELIASFQPAATESA